MNGWRRGVRSNKTCAAIFVTAFFAATLFATPRSSAAEIQTAAWMPGGELRHEAALPHVLATADAERYRLIFLLEGSGQWEAADREINGLKDRLLLGHVLALRYLHPRYRVTYDELAHWLDSYADQPDAKAIYALAQKRAPTAAAEPVKPVAGTLVPQSMEEDFGPRPLSRAEGGNGGEPDAHWQKGLAAWREGRFDEAATHFEALAKTPGQSPWTVSAGAFWAARAELKNRRPEHVAYWLGIAAERPHTFYGLIARKLLGVDALFNFDGESFTDVDARAVTGMQGGRRALAFLEVGDYPSAEAELRILAARGPTPLLRSITALADRANLPALSLQLASMLAVRDGRNHDHALYPVPRWTPHGGFSIDRALIFAVMRQESLFAPHVVSYAGARGLMQLMPATARSMAQQSGETLDDRRHRQHEELADPETNLTLAQEYINTLLKDDHIQGNLLLFALAYNGGPGALQHWIAAMPGWRSDPLLFLEMTPVAQSRIYTERVLTNYWIYRMRLRQSTPDLDALAAGQWPTYTALDQHEPSGRHVAQNQ